MYDGSGLVARADGPVDASCKDGTSCWRATNTAFKYRDHDGTPNGVVSGLMKAGKETTLKLGAKGANIGAPSLPSAGPAVTAQFISDEMNNCFGETYSGAGITANSAARFKTKSE